MSYHAIAIMSQDRGLSDRVAACAAVEGEADPEVWVGAHRWQYSARQGWADAYTYALEAKTPAPGIDHAVISDAMILTAVQEIRATKTATT